MRMMLSVWKGELFCRTVERVLEELFLFRVLCRLGCLVVCFKAMFAYDTSVVVTLRLVPYMIPNLLFLNK